MRFIILTALISFSFLLSLPTKAKTMSSIPTITSTNIEPSTTPYPDASLAPTQVHEAFATAAKTHRRILLDFGGNWCPDCRILAGIMNNPDVATWLEKHFVVIPINVERLTTNMNIAQHYSINIKAVPTVLMLTSDGRLINKDGALSLGSVRRMSPQAVVDLLAEWNNRP